MCAPSTWVDANKMFVISRKTIWDLRIENGEWNPCGFLCASYFVFRLHCILLRCRGAWGYEKYFYLNKHSNLMMVIPPRWTRSQHCNFRTIKFEPFASASKWSAGFREQSGCWVRSHVTYASIEHYCLAFEGVNVWILSFLLQIQVCQIHALCWKYVIFSKIESLAVKRLAVKPVTDYYYYYYYISDEMKWKYSHKWRQILLWLFRFDFMRFLYFLLPFCNGIIRAQILGCLQLCMVLYMVSFCYGQMDIYYFPLCNDVLFCWLNDFRFDPFILPFIHPVTYLICTHMATAASVKSSFYKLNKWETTHLVGLLFWLLSMENISASLHLYSYTVWSSEYEPPPSLISSPELNCLENILCCVFRFCSFYFR